MRATCATTALTASELVTEASPCACAMPARSRTPSAIASASIVRPRQAGSRCEKDEPTWSITVTSWSRRLSIIASSDPTRPQPTTITYMAYSPSSPTWYGTLVITIPRSNSSASRSRIAVCACSRLCQVLRGTNCGTTIVITSFGWRRAAISLM